MTADITYKRIGYMYIYTVIVVVILVIYCNMYG